MHLECIRRNKLITTGTYGIVRNPMCLGGILIFTFNLFIPSTWLFVSLLADAYFVFGVLIEEMLNIKRLGKSTTGT